MIHSPRMPTERERRRIWWICIIFMVVSIVGELAVGVKTFTWKLNHGYYKAEPSLPPDTGFGRYELDNYKFQIPVKYLYDFYETRGNRWLEDKPPQKVDGGVTFDVFLPDFKPYGPEVHGHQKKITEDRLYVSLADEANNPTGYPQDILIGRLLAGSEEEVASDLSGFRELHGRHNKQRYYFETPLTDTYFRMICNGTMCQTWVVFPEYPGLVVYYVFNEKHHWAERSQIHAAVKSLIGKFTVAQFYN